MEGDIRGRSCRLPSLWCGPSFTVSLFGGRKSQPSDKDLSEALPSQLTGVIQCENLDRGMATSSTASNRAPNNGGNQGAPSSSIHNTASIFIGNVTQMNVFELLARKMYEGSDRNLTYFVPRAFSIDDYGNVFELPKHDHHHCIPGEDAEDLRAKYQRVPHWNYAWNNQQLTRALMKSQRRTKILEYEMGLLARTANTDAAEAVGPLEAKLRASYKLIDTIHAENVRWREVVGMLAQKREPYSVSEIWREVRGLMFEDEAHYNDERLMGRLRDVKARNRQGRGAPSLKAMAARCLSMTLFGYGTMDVEHSASHNLPASNLDWLKIPRGYEFGDGIPVAALGKLEIQRPESPLRQDDPPTPPSPSISFSSLEELAEEELEYPSDWESGTPSDLVHCMQNARRRRPTPRSQSMAGGQPSSSEATS